MSFIGRMEGLERDFQYTDPHGLDILFGLVALSPVRLDRTPFSWFDSGLDGACACWYEI
jgi:hypothetical protein